MLSGLAGLNPPDPEQITVYIDYATTICVSDEIIRDELTEWMNDENDESGI